MIISDFDDNARVISDSDDELIREVDEYHRPSFMHSSFLKKLKESHDHCLCFRSWFRIESTSSTMRKIKSVLTLWSDFLDDSIYVGHWFSCFICHQYFTSTHFHFKELVSKALPVC